MAQTNSNILRSYFDEIENQKRLDLISKYLSEKFIAHGTPFVGMGVMTDDSSGNKITIKIVHPGTPAEGKLQAGDEILQVFDGESTRKTFEELKEGTWGQGVIGTPVTIRLRRENKEQEITIIRGLVQGYKFPYSLVEAGTKEYYKDWPDLKAHLVNVIDQGDMVAYHVEHTGHNVRYGRSAVWSEFGIVRIQEGKITDWWSTEDGFSVRKQLGYSIHEPALAKV